MNALQPGEERVTTTTVALYRDGAFVRVERSSEITTTYDDEQDFIALVDKHTKIRATALAVGMSFV